MAVECNVKTTEEERDQFTEATKEQTTMENEMKFENLYPILKALANGAGACAKKAMKDADWDKLVEEAEAAFAILRDHVEPVVPFAHVTEEQCREHARMVEEKYGTVICTNMFADKDVDCKLLVDLEPEQFIGMSEDQVRLASKEVCKAHFDTLQKEMESVPGFNGLYVVKEVEGFRTEAWAMEGPKDILPLVAGSSYIVYVKDGHLHGQYEANGKKNRYTFYTFKDSSTRFVQDIDPETDCVSVVPMLAEHFWWDMDENLSSGG